MIAVVCGVAVLGVIELFHLAVTTVLVRRLREVQNATAAPAPQVGGPEIGQQGPEPRSVPGLPADSDVLLGFFSSGCPSCRIEAPRFAGTLPALARDGVRAATVLAGGAGADRDALAALLEPTGVPLLDQTAREAFRAFSIKATPAFLLVRPDGTVAGKGTSVDEAMASATARETTAASA